MFISFEVNEYMIWRVRVYIHVCMGVLHIIMFKDYLIACFQPGPSLSGVSSYIIWKTADIAKLQTTRVCFERSSW